jgi:hypothetical protein
MATLTVAQARGSAASGLAVFDTAANAAAAAGFDVVMAASAVSLSGSAQISAAEATALSKAGSTLAVCDTAAEIAAHDAAVATLADAVLVWGSGTISADEADALAALQRAVPMRFCAGADLTVEDSLAALTGADNAAGVALASRIILRDSGASLATASGEDWGEISPGYSLSGASTVKAAQSAIRHGLGTRFLPNLQIAVRDSDGPLGSEALLESATVDVAQAEALLPVAHASPSGVMDATIAGTSGNLLGYDAILASGDCAETPAMTAMAEAALSLADYATPPTDYIAQGHAA